MTERPVDITRIVSSCQEIFLSPSIIQVYQVITAYNPISTQLLSLYRVVRIML